MASGVAADMIINYSRPVELPVLARIQGTFRHATLTEARGGSADLKVAPRGSGVRGGDSQTGARGDGSVQVVSKEGGFNGIQPETFPSIWCGDGGQSAGSRRRAATTSAAGLFRAALVHREESQSSVHPPDQCRRIRWTSAAKLREGLTLARQIFVPMDRPGIPITHRVILKPNATGVLRSAAQARRELGRRNRSAVLRRDGDGASRDRSQEVPLHRIDGLRHLEHSRALTISTSVSASSRTSRRGDRSICGTDTRRTGPRFPIRWSSRAFRIMRRWASPTRGSWISPSGRHTACA